MTRKNKSSSYEMTGDNKPIIETSKPVYTITEGGALSKPLVVNPATGILQQVQAQVSPATPKLGVTTPGINKVVTSYPPLVRPSGISDQIWAVMQSQGKQKIAQQQQAAADAAKAAKITAGIIHNSIIAAAVSGNDAMASAKYTAELNKVVTTSKGINSNVAEEISLQALRAAQSAKDAAAKPTATDEDKKAASVTLVIATQTVADAAKIKVEENRIIQAQAENTAIDLKVKADASDATWKDRDIAKLAEDKLNEANNNLMEAQTVSSDTAQAAADTKAKVESDEAAVAWALTHPEEILDKRNIFDKLIDFIYNKLYGQ